MKPWCACGCGQRAANRHHVVYQQKLRQVVFRETRDKRERTRRLVKLTADPRNLMWLAFDCHMAHHNRSRVLVLTMLPASAFEFAAELLGPGEAYEFMRRSYGGPSRDRLDELLAAA